jgi:DNA gyrase/topoisomerase IV subunit B
MTTVEKYVKLSDIEHVLLRPGMYIGGISQETSEQYLFDAEKNVIERKSIKYSPGLYKILDEILVNSMDHAVRTKGTDCPVTEIIVNLDNDSLSVQNNGLPIEVIRSELHGVYYPELIFGSLRSSENFDDNAVRMVGGTNGLGSKCVSPCTKILLFDGNIKLAKDIIVGDILIGDDGKKRTVLSTISGKGKMFEIIQVRGDNYKVNADHILTLHMPDHKIIFWNTNGWSILWWDSREKQINSRFFKAINNNIICNECEYVLNSNVKRHYRRIHPDKIIPIINRKLPTKLPDMSNPKILEALDKITTFSMNIPNDNVFDISIKDFMSLPETIRRRLAGVRGECVEWDHKDVSLDPYVLGLWLGDGYQYTCDGENDYQIMDYLKNWGETNDAVFSQIGKYPYDFSISSRDNFGRKGFAPIKKYLDNYGLTNNKHIPMDYLVNSRDVRLKVLAGLIDTDGTVQRDGTRIVFSQGDCHKQLFDDTIYLARSLGFCCTVNSRIVTYKYKDDYKESFVHILNISGNIQDIPTRLPRKLCKTTKKQNTDKSTGYIKIAEIEDSEFIGIHIDGNERFLINDFTVTHNCTNIFSKKFIVEVGDATNELKFYQEYSENMSKRTIPKITKCKKNYTKITVFPDFQRFDSTSFSKDDISLISRRVYDIAGCIGWVKIKFNGELIKISKFQDYAKMYGVSTFGAVSVDGYWEVAVGLADTFMAVSFVNGIYTRDGGKHVEYITKQLVDGIHTTVTRKNKGIIIKKDIIKNNIFLFIRCNINRPSFNSQTKDYLNTSVKNFGSKFEVPTKLIDSLGKLGLYDLVMLQNNQKVASDLKKTDGKKKNTVRVEKYISAEYSGTNKSNDCTLLLTEGDSCSADTPLLLRNSDDMIVIRTIDDIHNGEWVEEIGGKLYNTSGHKIWSDKGWTVIKHVMKHVVKKRMYRVLTHTGCIDVTEDHSLLNERGLEITPKDCIVGSKLLHSFPNFIDYSKLIPEDLSILDLKKLWKIASLCNIQFYQIYKRKELTEILNNYKTNRVEQINKPCSISTKEAYIMGFFFANGYCNIYNRKNSQRYYWALDNTNMDYLLKSKDILEKLYPDNIFKIKNNGNPKQENHLQQYRLCVYGGIDSKEFVEKYNNLMYSKDRCKIVPEGILNNSLEVRKNFYDGYCNGDGSKSKTDSERFDVIGKISAQGLYFLCKSIGLDVSLNIRNDKMKIYRLNVTRVGQHQQYDPVRIKKIIDLGIVESCVYDIETENHHFQGGIGQMIIHNSAATLMLAGLSQEQRKYFGVIPLKGKGLNICNATVKQLQENTELINIKKIMGLESGKKYTDVSELRYGRIMACCDSDVDGLHIKALLFNMFKNLWPSLFEMPNFINSFTTPIIKATKGNKVLSFFTEAEYIAFEKKKETGWKIKYYKGLGTSSKQEAMEYFKNLQKNTTEYEFSEASNEAFDKVFNKIRADDRKQWLSKYDRNSQSTGSKIRLDSFINNDFIHFSNDDLSRSIPNVLDGLKVSQRKILFSAFKRGLYSEIKVAQFAGYVSEHSGYHHGEKSLEDAIVGLAQNFIGSNNINLLDPIGMFGSRLNNGKDAASARYIFTHLSKITKLIFDQRDFGIVDYKNDDGTSVEPWWYIPIIPMILINGAVGIGTGFSTKIPCFNPKDIINVLLSKLKSKTGKELVPWYRNFTGKIVKLSDGIYITHGVFTETKKEIIITELPIGISVNDYLDYLNNKHSDNFKQITNLSTDTEICIKLTKRNDIKGILDTLKLTSKVSYSNMNAFDIDSRIMNFSSPETVIDYFFDVRLAYYSKRKRVLLAELDEIIRDLSNRIRFINEITTKRIKMSDISVAELSEYLQSKNFDKHENSYEYLYKMNLISLTKERQIKLKDKLFVTQTERNTLHSKSPSELYRIDLLNLLTYV